MRLDIADISRINTCGILNKNKWNLLSKDQQDPSFLFGMKEIFRWIYKRGAQIEYESFSSALSNYNLLHKVDHSHRATMHKAFREFLESHFHKSLRNVFMNYRTDIKVSKEDYLEYFIPVFSNNPEKPTFIYYDIGKESKEFFLRRYEVMHNAIWSFYYLDKLPIFVNVWFEDDKIQHEIIKVNEEYILDAKRNLITVGKNLKIFVLPPVQTCKTCINIKNCERFNKVKKRKTNGQS